VQEIADRIGLSQRQLERLFKTEFDLSPAKAYAEIRMAGARQEVIAGRRPLIDIALDYGYNVGTFSKVYRRVFGVLPSEDRQGPA
jgi:transcriptional regulator GlxA family with amidase domain